eukprot:5008250-Amphidinium_carterae.3
MSGTVCAHVAVFVIQGDLLDPSGEGSFRSLLCSQGHAEVAVGDWLPERSVRFDCGLHWVAARKTCGLKADPSILSLRRDG